MEHVRVRHALNHWHARGLNKEPVRLYLLTHTNGFDYLVDRLVSTPFFKFLTFVFSHLPVRLDAQARKGERAPRVAGMLQQVPADEVEVERRPKMV